MQLPAATPSPRGDDATTVCHDAVTDNPAGTHHVTGTTRAHH